MPARILIIEDNLTNTELMAYLLGSFAHTVLVANDGREGLAKARDQQPDLIICDLQLPRMDGYQIVRSLRQDAKTWGIPVVAVTALAMVGDRERALEAGFDGYMAKPIDPEAFVGQIEGFLAPSFSGSRPLSAGITPESARQSRRSICILAVDNVAANLDLIRGLFEPLGYDVVTAGTGQGALELASQNIPDLILSDICMPEMSGYDFIQAVRAVPTLAAIPFVFLTSTMLSEGDRAKGLTLGAARFLRRPIDAEELLSQIESCLAGGKSRGDNLDRR